MAILKSKTPAQLGRARIGKIRVQLTQEQSMPEWWKQKDPFQHVFPAAATLLQKQNFRFQYNIQYQRLYRGGTYLPVPYGVTNTTGQRAAPNTRSDRLIFNITKSCIDTSASKIAQVQPRTMFVTNRGDWGMQRKAELLTQYIDGQFDDLKLYEKGQKIFVDCAIYGTGFAKIFLEDNQIKVARVHPDEIIIDEHAALHEEPRTLYQRRFVDRALLLEQYPKFKKEINAAERMDQNGSDSQLTDMIVVVESWHLQGTQTSSDGKHVICISNATLVNEDYKYDTFPIIPLRWTDAPEGWFGIGICESIETIQMEINLLLYWIHQAQKLVCNPRIWLPMQSKVAAAQINNAIGAIIKYAGPTPPQIVSPQGMSSEVYQHLENLMQKAYSIAGISQLSASSIKPAGIESAVAMREMVDIESDRFTLLSQRLDTFYLDITKWIIRYSRELYAEKSSNVRIKGRKFIDTIPWKQVNLEDDQYVLEMQSTNILPRTIAGRIQTAQEFVQAGWISPQTAMQLLRIPDTDQAISIATAAQDNIERIIEGMLYESKYQAPDQYLDLATANKLAIAAYNMAQQQNAPERNLDLLRRWIDDVQQLLQAAQQPPPAAPGGQPLGVPAQPSISPLSPLKTAAQPQ